MRKAVWCGITGVIGLCAQAPSHGPAGPLRFSRPHRRPASPRAAPETAGTRTTSATGPGIVYTCDPSITAADASACTVLNTTIASFYSSAFTNANASIYVKMGNTDLGESDYVYVTTSYANFRSALTAAQSDANDATAVSDSLPSNSPFGADKVEMPNGLARALGFASLISSGIPASGEGSCTAGATGCYDGLITLSNTASLYFRTGAISSSQYDFFTIVQHETDEILGTASCVFGCGNDVAPADFFRYHSNGARSFAAGTNDVCTSSDATNACFSLDGVHMLQQYNNIDNGEDGGDWAYGCSQPYVQNAVLCPGTAGVNISPASEILVLDVVGFTVTPASGAVSYLMSTTPPATYGVGAAISIQVVFNETVNVTGTPQLALNSGGVAYYASGTGSDTLNFLYDVGAGQNSNRLDAASSSALTGGGITGTNGGAVSLTLPAPGATASLSADSDLTILTSATITIETSPEGLQFTVDGGASQTAPQTLSLTAGSHTIAVAATQNPSLGVMDVFAGWSDGGPLSHTITVGSGAETYIAYFSTEYQLTVGVAPEAGGTVIPSSGNYYFAGTQVSVTATTNAGYAFTGWTGPVTSAASAATTVNMTAPATVIANFVSTSGLAFFPVTPCRIADTRSGSGQFGAPSLAAGSTRTFNLTQSACNIPASGQAYSLNVTVVPAATLYYLSIWPAGQPQPTVSTLNSPNGQVVANAAIVQAGTAGGTSGYGAIDVYASDATDVILDIDGYFAPMAADSLAFYPLTPCRVADTRGAVGTFGGPQMTAGQTRAFPVGASACNVPAAAQAYSLNITAVPPGPLVYLSVWPAGESQPVVSTLNSYNGTVVANAALAPAGAGSGGPIDIYVSNASDVVIDINGYFAAPGAATPALYFFPVTPCRIADTRAGSGFPVGFGPPSLAAGATRTFAVQSSGCNLPAVAEAYAFNMTVVPPGPLTYLTAWPAGETQPVVSTLNSYLGTVVANAAIVPAGSGGAINIFVSNPTDFLLDVNGYFAQ